MTVKKEKVTGEKKSKPRVKKTGEETKKDSVDIQNSIPGAVPEILEKPGKQKKRSSIKKTETSGVSEAKIEEKAKRGRKKTAPVKENTELLPAPAVSDVKHEVLKPRKKAEQTVEVKHGAEPVKKEVQTEQVKAGVPVAPQEKPIIQPPKVAVPIPAAPGAVPVSAVPAAPVPPVSVTPVARKELELNFPIAVKDFAIKLQEKPSILIKYLMSIGVMAGINQMIDEQTVRKTCEKYGYQIKLAPNEEEAALGIHLVKDTPESLKPRAPIITLMGHVDHGKTSLLDAIRKSKVAETEHGGITQHIGAYRLKLPHGEITFLDTPGHEAFTAMRARGAKATDIVILVVAADDGIMPQTKEAADHAKAAGVTIVVAVNKIDKPQADLDRVKKQLTELDLLAEDWGGKTITVPVSAKTGEGIDALLEMLILEAEMLELKANPNRLAQGVVLEGKMVKNKGPVATLLVQNGTLRLNNYLLVGHYHGKIRAMFNDRGHSVTEAGPSMPVEVLGISGIPEAGEQFYVLEDEKLAKELAVKRQEQERD
ncbi:MAG: translation initiation factor IF-2, partial [Candidatus Omnitrophica bacterium]|nr:translation initiation factor IF-2 [Candidatus Omnitrophota bacterium]